MDSGHAFLFKCRLVPSNVSKILTRGEFPPQSGLLEIHAANQTRLCTGLAVHQSATKNKVGQKGKEVSIKDQDLSNWGDTQTAN